MAILYITDQGASLTKRGNQLVVTKQGKTIQEVHAFKVEQVAIMGNISLTPSAISFLLQEGIDTVFLSYHGKYKGRLISQHGKNVELRRKQFQRIEDPAFRLRAAREFVRGKLVNCRVVLRRQNQTLHDPEVVAALTRIRRFAAQLETCDSHDGVMGVEGVSAAAYFGCFGKFVRAPDITFHGRNRRPPRDPVNVLLSLGYTLLANAIHTQVNIVGLDPYVGCLHSTEYGRPSLVLDLMEEFRPALVDALVLYVVNRGVIQTKHFFRPEEREPAAFDFAETEPIREEYPIILTHEGMKRFVASFEERLSVRILYEPLGRRLTYRGVLLEQVRRFANMLTDDIPYRAFVMR
ncbi:MAG: CRISPR-associated endonuclease Cas1 [Desulfomonilaceae bacterium]